MSIMRLIDVPEITEFAGTEKIYVNDNGTTKQIACDKVVTAGTGSGGGRFILDNPSKFSVDAETLVTALEEGKDIWINLGSEIVKIIGFDWSGSTGSVRLICASYITNSGGGDGSGGTATLASIGLTAMSSTSDLYTRFIAVFTP
jgi:hypothetical protein